MNGLDRCFFDQRKFVFWSHIRADCAEMVNSFALRFVEALFEFNGKRLRCINIFSGRAGIVRRVNYFQD